MDGGGVRVHRALAYLLGVVLVAVGPSQAWAAKPSEAKTFVIEDLPDPLGPSITKSFPRLATVMLPLRNVDPGHPRLLSIVPSGRRGGKPSDGAETPRA